MKIRSDVLRIYQLIHSWTGIFAGIILFIGFFAGSLTMFKDQIAQWATPPHHVLAPVKFTQLDSLISQATSSHDKARSGFSLYLNDTTRSPMMWYEQGTARGLALDKQRQHASLNAQGQLITHRAEQGVLAELIDQLHRSAGIAGAIGYRIAGEYVLGTAAIVYFLAIVSGIIFLLPSLTKNFFAIRKDKSEKRFWLDTHNLVGITSLPFHLVISLTVVVFTFNSQIYASLGTAVYGDQPLFPRSNTVAHVYPFTELPPVAKFQAIVDEQAPGYIIKELRFVGLDTAWPFAQLGIYNPTALMRGPTTDYIFMHPFTLEVSNNSASTADDAIWNRIVASFYALHFGSFGGDIGRWSYFILGLGGAFLFYSGNLLWLEKRRVKQQSAENVKQTRACRLMAAATVGMCLGSIAGVAITMVVAKWLYPLVDNINHAYLYSYYGVFFSFVFYSFYKGAAKAAITLLKVCMFSCFAITATSLVAMLLPQLGLYVVINFTSIGVDIVALLAGFAFMYFYKITKHRALYGPKDSVWALPKPLSTI
ncbi:PepSY-associated TM helix domain-containing protein [Pseudoalteromonas neustonica]|uniref:Peptidase n=2 Tax=Pseudoalteromonas TaxID=53246 RepID=A0A0N1EQ08_9GAMM|nr:PepSY-associated TM helix domain-containing protein [Pseudoalteromonas porphyrae]KPH65426.1 peptidase [Pseudoalteromonas porphyrae]